MNFKYGISHKEKELSLIDLPLGYFSFVHKKHPESNFIGIKIAYNKAVTLGQWVIIDILKDTWLCDYSFKHLNTGTLEIALDKVVP